MCRWSDDLKQNSVVTHEKNWTEKDIEKAFTDYNSQTEQEAFACNPKKQKLSGTIVSCLVIGISI